MALPRLRFPDLCVYCQYVLASQASEGYGWLPSDGKVMPTLGWRVCYLMSWDRAPTEISSRGPSVGFSLLFQTYGSLADKRSHIAWVDACPKLVRTSLKVKVFGNCSMALSSSTFYRRLAGHASCRSWQRNAGVRAWWSQYSHKRTFMQ